MMVQTISGVCKCGHDWDSHTDVEQFVDLPGINGWLKRLFKSHLVCAAWMTEIEPCLCMGYEDEYEL